jgi:HEAT repeat protein
MSGAIFRRWRKPSRPRLAGGGVVWPFILSAVVLVPALYFALKVAPEKSAREVIEHYHEYEGPRNPDFIYRSAEAYMRLPPEEAPARARAAGLLHLGGLRAVKSLEGTLADPDPKVRRAALRSAFQIAIETRDSRLAPLLAGRLGDGDPVVRQMAEEAIVINHPDIKGIAPALAEVQASGNPEGRRRAARLLSSLCSRDTDISGLRLGRCVR